MTMTTPDVLPDTWFGADVNRYVAQDHDVLPGDTLLIATDQESLTPQAEDGDDAMNYPIPVGSMLYALREGPDGGQQTVRCGFHKDYYPTIPSNQGLIWGKVAIRMQPFDPSEVRVGDLIARRSRFMSGGAAVGLVTEVRGRVVGVAMYRATDSTGRMERHVDSGTSIWDIADPDLTKHLVRAVTWTSDHPLTEREDTTVSIDTPTVNETATTAAVPDTLCKDPAHEGIVVQLQEKDSRIEALQRELSYSRMQHRDDIEHIGEGFWAEARRRGWCDDAQAAILDINRGLNVELPIPEEDYNVQVRVQGETEVNVADNGLSVDVTVNWEATGTVVVQATSDTDAEERVEQDSDLVTEDLSSLTFAVTGVDGDAEVDDESYLVVHLESSATPYDVTNVDIEDVRAA